jgi:hypothetical protein
VTATVPDGPPVDGDAKLLTQLMHSVIGAVVSLAILAAALPDPEAGRHRRSVALSVLLAGDRGEPQQQPDPGAGGRSGVDHRRAARLAFLA